MEILTHECVLEQIVLEDIWVQTGLIMDAITGKIIMMRQKWLTNVSNKNTKHGAEIIVVLKQIEHTGIIALNVCPG